MVYANGHTLRERKLNEFADASRIELAQRLTVLLLISNHLFTSAFVRDSIRRATNIDMNRKHAPKLQQN